MRENLGGRRRRRRYCLSHESVASVRKPHPAPPTLGLVIRRQHVPSCTRGTSGATSNARSERPPRVRPRWWSPFRDRRREGGTASVSALVRTIVVMAGVLCGGTPEQRPGHETPATSHGSDAASVNACQLSEGPCSHCVREATGPNEVAASPYEERITANYLSRYGRTCIRLHSKVRHRTGSSGVSIAGRTRHRCETLRTEWR
jgi:hypothetical protein